jgi:hypothetical protein
MVRQNLGPNLAGMRLLFADQFKELIVPHDRLSGKEPICSPVSSEGRATCA